MKVDFYCGQVDNACKQSLFVQGATRCIGSTCHFSPHWLRQRKPEFHTEKYSMRNKNLQAFWKDIMLYGLLINVNIEYMAENNFVRKVLISLMDEYQLCNYDILFKNFQIF